MHGAGRLSSRMATVACLLASLTGAGVHAWGDIPAFAPLPTVPRGGPTVAVDRFGPPTAQKYAWLGTAISQDVMDRLARTRAIALGSAWYARDLLAPGGKVRAPVDAETAKAAFALIQPQADVLVQGRCTVKGDVLTVAAWAFRPEDAKPESTEVSGEVGKPLELAREVALWATRTSGVVLSEADIEVLSVHGTDNSEALKWFALGVEASWLRREPDAPESASAKARAAFEKAVALDPGFRAPYDSLATEALGTERAQEGGRAGLKSLALTPYHPTSVAYRGSTFGRIWAADEEMRQEALRLYAELPDLELLRGPIAYGKAGLLAAIGDVDGALEAYAVAAEHEPMWAMPWLQAGMLAQRHERHDEALEAYRHFLAFDDQWEEGWRTVGRLLLMKQEWQEALDAYERAAKLAPGNAKAHVGRGDALAGLGRGREAVGAFQEALELDPTRQRDILTKLAPLYSQDPALDDRLAGDVSLQLAEDATVQDALAALTGATAVPMFAEEQLAERPLTMETPTQSASQAMRVLAASVGGLWRFERNVYMLEPDPALTAKLDHLTPELERHEVLAPLLAEAKEKPDEAFPLSRLALALSRRGYHVLALQYAENAFALDPAIMPAGTLGRYYQKCGHLAEAAGFYGQAAQEGSAAAQSSLAHVLWKLGDFDKAIEAQRAYIPQLRTPAVGHSNLAGSLYRLGRLDEAREEVRLAIQGAEDPDRRQKRERLLELIEKRAADPEAPRKLLQKGKMMMRFGQPLFAAEAFAAAANLDPTLTEAQEAVAEARLAIEEALK